MNNAERFWGKVDRRSRGECWEWQGAKSLKGYGQFGEKTPRGYKTRQAHRFSYCLTFGSIPQGLYVLHKCDNRTCVNPDHLYLGSQLENMRDMIERGRSRGKRNQKGEKNNGAKLTPDQVREIRRKYNPGVCTYAMLGKEYGVAWGTIRDIVKRRNWDHVS